MTIDIVSIIESDCIDDPDAVDVSLYIDGGYGEMTLRKRDSDGVYDSWGSGIDHWLTPSLHSVDRATLAEAVAEARDHLAVHGLISAA